MLGLLFSAMLLGADAPAPDTVVVVRDELRTALEPWVIYREAQGHEMAFVDATLDAAAIHAEIRRIAAPGHLRFVLLVGDAPTLNSPPNAPTVATHLLPAKVNVHWGSEREIASDNSYGDLDGDHLPELAVGRLTADNATELRTMIRKILKYESQRMTEESARKLNFVAGVGGFGAVVDSVLENATKKFLTEGIPAEYSVSMTYGSWRSPYCPDPRRFRETTIQRFNEGCLFWVYIGHGQKTFLDRVHVPGAVFPILDTDDVPRMRSEGQMPIAVFLACYTGAFDHPRDCLAEMMLRSPQGPVAVYAGSRVTMPYAMAVMGNELLRAYFQSRPETIGELLVQAKRAMAQDADPQDANVNRKMVDAIAAAISPKPDQLSEERLEHLLLFNLLGDPLLRLKHFEPIEVALPKNVYAGDSIEIDWETSVEGDCSIELVCRRDRMRFPQSQRSAFMLSDEHLAEYDQTYALANDRLWTSAMDSALGQRHRTVLKIPDDVRGPCYVRLVVDGGQRRAAGSQYVFVRRPLKKPTAAIPSERR